MESLWTALRHIKTILLWAVALTALVAAVASAETARDWIATSPDDHDRDILLVESKHDEDIQSIERKAVAHIADYQRTAERVVTNCRHNKQATINGYLDQITNINIRKAGAAQEVRAVLLLLENTMNQQIAKAETEKAKC